ncbi:GRAM domain-containing protein 3-like [Labeo rohita]|uniref:GRAM domain-containing protein 3-like n=1 Tax=Labeo rohita TaxID=84645 RepID=A0A498N3B5_LABRO|nr:GRAM domain-containing protein 3-like [Labeo rohita]
MSTVILMEKHLVSEDSVQCRNDAVRPMCSVPPHQQMNECVLLRQYAENIDEEEGQKMTRPDAFISLDAEADVSVRRRKTTLVRSKTFDPSLLLQVQSDSESKCERRKPQPCQIAIPVSSVAVIKKTKTAILVPNALVISTAHDRHVFVSFLSRDTTYKVLMSVCPHLVEKSPGISQIPSQSLRGHPASLPTDFTADLSDLDGPVRQTGQHMDDSSSSDCAESPDFIKTPSSSGLAEVVFMKTLRPVSLSLNALVLIYLSLVCVLLLSSCYMAFKIVSLEERLTSLVSMEFPHKRYHMAKCCMCTYDSRDEILFAGDTAEISSVLSASLLKLEKIHRNLQRLLETISK